MVAPPRGWHPPKVLGYNAFAALYRSMVCRRSGLLLAAAAHMLTHLHLHVRWRVAADAWRALQSVVTETCVALSWFSAGGSGPHTAVLWLPWSLAAPLIGQRRRRPAAGEPQAPAVLRSALQLLPLLLRRCAELEAPPLAANSAPRGGEGEDQDVAAGRRASPAGSAPQPASEWRKVLYILPCRARAHMRLAISVTRAVSLCPAPSPAAPSLSLTQTRLHLVLLKAAA